MRVLVCFAGGPGHLLPMLPLARALHEAGHELALAGHPDQVESHGVFSALLPRERVGAGRPAAVGTDATGTLVPPDLEHELDVVGRWYAGILAQRVLPQTAALLEAWRPDLLVCDEMDFGSIAAASRAGTPSVVVEVIATGALTRPDRVATPLDALGLDLDAARGDLTVSPFPASWRDPGAPAGAKVVRVRPEAGKATAAGVDPHPAATWLGPGDGAAAYLTLGTEFNTESGDLLGRLAAGLLAEPGRVLATVGVDLDPTVLAGVGGHGDAGRLRVEHHVPQDDVLARADVVVCHGGSGTVIGAMAHGVPVVVAPLGADQEPNAARVRALGVGAVLDAVRCTPDDVRATVSRVRWDPAVRAAVGAVQAEIAALPTAATLVPRLEVLVHRP